MAKVLIIDDDPHGREMLRFRLQKAGHQVREASDGEEGLRDARRQIPDLVFLDVRIPKMDGWEVCRQLKTDEQTKKVPVIMLTGCSQPAQESYGRQCGADAYITKPWEADDLLKAMERLLLSSQVGMQTDLEELKLRTKTFGLQIIGLVNKLPRTAAADVFGRELVSCGTSVGAAYRAACGAQSSSEFVTKLKAVQKEADQAVYWLGLLLESSVYDSPEVHALLTEGKSLASLFAASRKTFQDAA